MVYVAGTGRSGSTLLGNTIGSLPGALSVGEVKLGFRRGLVEDGFCGCRRLVRECPVWTSALTETFGAIPTRAEAARLDDRLAAAVRTRTTPWWLAARTSTEVAELSDLLGRLLTALARAADVEVIVDSSKLPAYGALLARSDRLDVRTVHLVRDPRAVAWSWQRHSASQQVSGFEEDMERFSPVKSSLMWLESSSSVAALARRDHRGRIVVRYEDFVADPRETLHRIAEFAGLDRPGAVDRIVGGTPGASELSLADSHAVAGNPNRVRSGPIMVRSDDEWASRMPTSERRMVSAITAARRWVHGY